MIYVVPVNRDHRDRTDHLDYQEKTARQAKIQERPVPRDRMLDYTIASCPYPRNVPVKHPEVQWDLPDRLEMMVNREWPEKMEKTEIMDPRVRPDFLVHLDNQDKPDNVDHQV